MQSFIWNRKQNFYADFCGNYGGIENYEVGLTNIPPLCVLPHPACML